MRALAEGKTTISFIPLENIPQNNILKGILTGVKINCYYTYGIKESRMDLYFAV